MSVLGKESIKIIGETQGIKNVPDAVAGHLAQDVEYRLREIVQDALKLMKHTHRERLTCADVDGALRLRNVEVIVDVGCVAPVTCGDC